MSEPVHAAGIASKRHRWIKVMALLVMLVSLAHNTVYGIVSLPIDKGMSSLGMNAGSDLTDGYALVDATRPGGPADEAGIRVGDRIRFERALDLYRVHLPPGETLNVVIRRGDERLTTTVTAPPSRATALAAEPLAASLMYSLLALAGGLIAIRSRRASGVTLGGALAAMALVGSYTILWENHALLQPVLTAIYYSIILIAPVALLGFALLRRSETQGRPIPLLWRIVFWAYAGLQAFQAALGIWSHISLRDIPAPADSFVVTLTAQWAGFALALVVLMLGLRETRGEERTRYSFLTGALALLFMGGHGLTMLINATSNDFAFSNPLSIASHVLTAAGIVGFLYAALRHRVVDLGFAVNRTLVYGLLSTALVVVFFFLSWGVDQVIPASMQQSNLLVSTGIALMLFFAFHHAQGWVEKAVQGLFFRRWRRQEREFRRFLRQTGFVNRPDVLAASATEAISRFADTAPVALYRLSDGAYDLMAGEAPNLPARLDADAPWLVRLRAEMAPQDEDLPEGVALILPMPYRSEVTGLVAVGARPDEEAIRPDQAELLAEAAVKIGLDLHALRVIALESETRQQRLRADVLERQLERLVKVGAPALETAPETPERG